MDSKKGHHERRIDLYSIPHVDEIIFSDEWNKEEEDPRIAEIKRNLRTKREVEEKQYYIDLAKNKGRPIRSTTVRKFVDSHRKRKRTKYGIIIPTSLDEL